MKYYMSIWLNALFQQKNYFSKISVIPLETNDSSFLVRPVKVIIKDNRYYIVDEGVPAVFFF